eukprot:GGOE01002056.1.p1 GENE.GGOE01002056.1~~GGOE01002056.1.p1  ORF type:complete len:1414 (-),score=516.23 GGOE01002056.1:25-4002(-)
MSQDMFLIGPPGPFRRWLALRYCHLVGREVEYLTISRDTTEADIKVRREIAGGSVHWINQSAVNAAIHGRVLILDGIEKAERNVLPILNNLLENREMALDDGRFLMNAQRYDELVAVHGAEEMERLGYVRVSPDFRVIALGLPVPPYNGTPLDPPLRSRFQCLAMDPLSPGELMEHLLQAAPQANFAKLKALVGFVEALMEVDRNMADQDSSRMFLDFGELEAIRCAKALDQFPDMSITVALEHVYPVELLGRENSRKAAVFADVVKKFDTVANAKAKGYKVEAIEATEERMARLNFQPLAGGSPVVVEVPCGAGLQDAATRGAREGAAHQHFVPLPCHDSVLSAMLLDHVLGNHMCLVSENGNGKTSLAHQFCRMLGYDGEMHTVQLYADMATRDLLQRRVTTENGDTVWRLTPLMKAAKYGGLAILDGVDKLKPGCLPFLQRLLVDHEVALYDGTLFKTEAEFELLKQQLACSDEELEMRKVFRVHKSFRVIALASSSAGLKWLQNEAQCMFSYHYIRPLTNTEAQQVITGLYPKVSAGDLRELLAFQTHLSSMAAKDPSLKPLSLRQLLRVARHLANFPSEVRLQIARCILYVFQPLFQQQKLEQVFKACGLPPVYAERSTLAVEAKDEKVEANTVRRVTIGKVSLALPRADMEDASSHTLVPSVLFYDNPQHTRTLQELLMSYSTGDHLLLIGNQGVGKNKLADRLLHLLSMPRHYIQLHRDTTVQSLTVTPAVHGGVVHWEDSPLVKAVKAGHVLVVDEVDKAPVEVVGVLKGLIEDRQMALGDGRRIVGDLALATQDPNAIAMHPRFRLFALSNRPGYPFLGNDFFMTCGDLFACHSIDNPDEDSIRAVLRSYGPAVPMETINLVIEAFTKLGALVDKGMLSYPYSLREMVNVVKHLQRYPFDGLEAALSNVFHFDRHDPTTYRVLAELFQKFGVKLGYGPVGPRFVEPLQIEFLHSANPPPIGDLKHGKEDPDNSPHVGGNQWAGGTGGTDTAGLGGRVGPYRLDKGHPVHQVSDEEKAAVPEEVKAQARAMGKEALAKRLQEIAMSSQEDDLYKQIHGAVANQIGIIKEMLKGLQSKSVERTWLRNQTEGVWDENKLIEGLTGEKAIFKRRSEDPNSLGWTGEVKKKRMIFVLDCSASMFRFNGSDKRLNRTLEAAVMIMEGFHGYEDKLWYTITGHSGDEISIPLVQSVDPPQNKLERLRILQRMYAHSQYCWSGDNTLEATHHAIKEVTKDEGSEYFVIVISDANFHRYRIKPQQVASTMTADPNVKTFCIFIASMWNEAQGYIQQLPAGQAFVCLDTKELPNILRQIFISTHII